ncbi:MAG: prolipoprotein diacylglyceryl transferase [Ferruginibacter sp.]|nr:prolipoprotein diacylglyceryl transferase [Ferruginibacter sp.]
MHYPVEINFFKQSLPLHFIMETAGFFFGFRYFLYLRKRQGDTIASINRTWILVGAIFGALIGSRLIGSLERPYELFRTKNIWLYIYSNKTVLGGFLGGLFGVELIKKLLKEKHSSGDLFTYPMILALIIGRIGCFSMGVYEETYGTPTTFFTGMDLGDGMLRHPVTLYEILFLLLLWITLVQVDKSYKLAEGARFKLFMIGYILFRFFCDFIKPSYIVVFGLSTIQLTALLGLLYYAVISFRCKNLYLSR